MTLHKIPELSKKELRVFGLETSGIIVVVFGLLLPWLFNLNYPLIPWYLAGFLAIWSIIAPETMRGLYRGWMRFGILLSKLTTPIVIGLVFIVAILPVALVMKLIGRDLMDRKLDETLVTYRKPSKKIDFSKMEKPF